MVFAIIVRDLPETSRQVPGSDEQRAAFLQSLMAEGRLLLEGRFGDSGSLILLSADSVNHALALLQDDPYVLMSPGVQVRPFVLNHLGGLNGDDGSRTGRSKRTRVRRTSVQG